MVVGKQEPNSAAATEPKPLTASEGAVGKRSPAASALSMFCNDPTTLKRPIGKITDK